MGYVYEKIDIDDIMVLWDKYVTYGIYAEVLGEGVDPFSWPNVHARTLKQQKIPGSCVPGKQGEEAQEKEYKEDGFKNSHLPHDAHGRPGFLRFYRPGHMGCACSTERGRKTG